MVSLYLKNYLMEQDENLKMAMANFNSLERRLLEKQEKVTELESLLEKMEQVNLYYYWHGIHIHATKTLCKTLV